MNDWWDTHAYQQQQDLNPRPSLLITARCPRTPPLLCLTCHTSARRRNAHRDADEPVTRLDSCDLPTWWPLTEAAVMQPPASRRDQLSRAASSLTSVTACLGRLPTASWNTSERW